jgi:hypothetical protein
MAYLYTHQNPHAPVRANGRRFWGYPQRRTPVRVLVVHTAENTPDTVTPDGGAEAVAAYQARVKRPSSYHELVDSDTHVVMLPPQAVAFGARGANGDGWHLSFATKAHLWTSMPDRWVDAALARGAARLAAAARLHGVPLTRIDRGQWRAGASGVISHAAVDPDRRSDPGADFPWSRFLDLARGQHQEDDMLRRDQTGPDVEWLQDRLNLVLDGRRDGRLNRDGDYGKLTAAAVREAKQLLGWPEDDADHASGWFGDRLGARIAWADDDRKRAEHVAEMHRG